MSHFKTLKKVNAFLKNDIVDKIRNVKVESPQMTNSDVDYINNLFINDLEILLSELIAQNVKENSRAYLEKIYTNTSLRRQNEASRYINSLESIIVEFEKSEDIDDFKHAISLIHDDIIESRDGIFKKLRKKLYCKSTIKKFSTKKTFWDLSGNLELDDNQKSDFIIYYSSILRLKYWKMKLSIFEKSNEIISESLIKFEKALNEDSQEKKQVKKDVPANHYALLLYLLYRIKDIDPLSVKYKTEFEALLGHLLAENNKDYKQLPKTEISLEEILKYFKPNKRNKTEDVFQMLRPSKQFDLMRNSLKAKSSFDTTLNFIKKEYLFAFKQKQKMSDVIDIFLKGKRIIPIK